MIKVQLVNAYDKYKDKLENPSQPVQLQGAIPLIQEGRSLRGHGFLTKEGLEWTKKPENDPYSGNPVHIKYIFQVFRLK